MNMESPFVWGRGGKPMTPEEVERERRIAEALIASGTDTSPVQHWTQGAARVANALAGAVRRGRADSYANEQRSALGGLPLYDGAPSASGSSASTSSPPVPTEAPFKTSIGPSVLDPEGPSSDAFRSQNAMGGIDPKDMDTAVRTVLAEAGNQGPTGMQAVAAVLRNRAQMAGTTLGQEALKPNQFEPWNPGSGNDPRRFDPASPEYQSAYKAVLPVLTGQGDDPTGGATHFYAPKAQAALRRAAPSWDNGTGVDLGDHRFFKLPYGGGGQAAQAPNPQQVASADPGFVPTQAAAAAAAPSPVAQVAQAMPQAVAQPSGQMQVAQALSATGPRVNVQNAMEIASSPWATPQQKAQAQVAVELWKQQQSHEYDRAKTAEERGYQTGVRREQRGYQIEDRNATQDFQRGQSAETRNFEQPYKDAASANAAGNLDVARQRLDLDRNKKPTNVQEFEYGQDHPEFVAQQERLKRAGAQNINLGGGSDKQIFDALEKSAETARSAATGLTAIQEARKAVEAGGIFGAGADFNLGLAKLGAKLGLTDPDAAVNTETFRAAIAPQVAATLKATVGTTQISENDRKFAERAAGGDIALDEKSIKRLLDIMERGGMAVLEGHQKRLESVYPDGANFARERALFGVQAPAGTPVRVTSPDEARKLPPGTPIILPDDSRGVVPPTEAPEKRSSLDDGEPDEIQLAMAGDGRPNWQRMIQNAPNDEALKRIIRQMLKEGIEPPVQIMPPGYQPRIRT